MLAHLPTAPHRKLAGEAVLGGLIGIAVLLNLAERLDLGGRADRWVLDRISDWIYGERARLEPRRAELAAELAAIESRLAEIDAAERELNSLP